MSVTTATNKAQFTGDAIATAFAFTFKISEEADLKVYLDEALQTITTHYTLSATNNDFDNGGTCTFLVAPASGVTVTLERVVANTSSLDLTAGDSVPAEVFEDAVDRLTFQIQQLDDKLKRAITVPTTDPLTLDLELVEDSQRTVNQGLIFNASGEPIVGKLLSASPLSTFMQTVADDSDAAEAMRTLQPSIAKSADYTITDADPSVVRVTAGATTRTITLPTAADNTDRTITIIKVDAGVGFVVIDGEGAELVGGLASINLETLLHSAVLKCDGTEWHVIAETNKKDAVLEKTADYTIKDQDPDTIIMTTGASDRTITLPTAAANRGRRITIIKDDDTVTIVIVDGEGAETVNGVATFGLYSHYQQAEVLCTGTEWLVLNTPLTAVFRTGLWNMDTVQTIEAIDGRNLLDTDRDGILATGAMIEHDVGKTFREIHVSTVAGGGVQIVHGINPISLDRAPSPGVFDGVGYDDGGIARGWATVRYVPGADWSR